MRRCPLNKVPAGAVLGCPVCNEHGAVLVQAGVALDERALAYLRGLGIAHVYVDSGPGPCDLVSASEEQRRRIAQREWLRFGDIDHNPVMMALRAATIETKLAAELETEAGLGDGDGGQANAGSGECGA